MRYAGSSATRVRTTAGAGEDKDEPAKVTWPVTLHMPYGVNSPTTKPGCSRGFKLCDRGLRVLPEGRERDRSSRMMSFSYDKKVLNLDEECRCETDQAFCRCFTIWVKYSTFISQACCATE